MRFESEYKYTDNIKLKLGIILYAGGENDFYENLEDGDIFFIKLSFDHDFI